MALAISWLSDTEQQKYSSGIVYKVQQSLPFSSGFVSTVSHALLTSLPATSYNSFSTEVDKMNQQTDICHLSLSNNCDALHYVRTSDTQWH